MNKYAADKIAQEYYNLGVQHALGHIKQAGFKPFGLKLAEHYLSRIGQGSSHE